MGRHTNRPTFSPSAVSTTKEVKQMTAPKPANITPSNKGKYPGPMRAPVPMEYLVAPHANAAPTTKNMRPEKKSF